MQWLTNRIHFRTFFIESQSDVTYQAYPVLLAYLVYSITHVLQKY